MVHMKQTRDTALKLIWKIKVNKQEMLAQSQQRLLLLARWELRSFLKRSFLHGQGISF